jgi:hypothetical protein
MRLWPAGEVSVVEAAEHLKLSAELAGSSHAL